MLTGLPSSIAAAQERALAEVAAFQCAHSGRHLLKVVDVLDAHFLLAEYFVDKDDPMTFGLRSPRLLASALDRQVVAIGTKLKWTDPFDIIATTFFGLVKNHAFHDGNKRTALLSLLYHLWLCGRVFTETQKVLERVTLAVAEDRLGTVHARARQFAKGADAEVRFLSWYLRRNSREIDRRDYVVTYRQLDAILRKFGFGLANPKGNHIDVVKRTNVRKRVGLLRREVVEEEHRVCHIGFPGWKSQVSKRDLSTVRAATNLVPESGYDSQVFFMDVNPMEAFVTAYEGALMRLATK